MSQFPQIGYCLSLVYRKLKISKEKSNKLYDMNTLPALKVTLCNKTQS